MDYVLSAVEYLIDLKHKWWDGKTETDINTQLDSHLDHNLCKLVYSRAGSSFSCLVEKDKLESKDFMLEFTDYITHDTSDTIKECALLDATLNGEIDITERFNKYLGNSGDHVNILGTNPKIKWLLTPEEIENFKKLQILTSECQNIDYDDINERIKKEIFFV